MLECHGREIKNMPKNEFRTINFFDTWNHTNRVIEMGICPVCGKLKAKMTYWDEKNKRYDYDKPKRRETVAEWMAKYNNDPYMENVIEPQVGSWINTQFRCATFGNIYDLNGTKKEKINSKVFITV